MNKKETVFANDLESFMTKLVKDGSTLLSFKDGADMTFEYKIEYRTNK